MTVYVSVALLVTITCFTVTGIDKLVLGNNSYRNSDRQPEDRCAGCIELQECLHSSHVFSFALPHVPNIVKIVPIVIPCSPPCPQ